MNYKMRLIFCITLFFSIANSQTKNNDIEKIVIKKEKKAIEYKADRVIFSINSIGNAGLPLLDNLKKIPGLIVSDIAGLMYQGKLLAVYLDNRPLNINSNELFSFLESMPSNSVEKVEIITNPGAEFPATSGGEIINIVTSNKSINFLSGAISNNSSYTLYDKLRYKSNTSVFVSSRNNYFSWNINFGNNNRENYQRNNFISSINGSELLLSNSIFDRTTNTNFLKSTITFYSNSDKFILNYNHNSNTNDADINSNGFNFITQEVNSVKSKWNDFAFTYQRRRQKDKLDVLLNYYNNFSSAFLKSSISSNPIFNNESIYNLYVLKADYSTDLNFLDETTLKFGGLYNRINFKTSENNIENFKYDRITSASYIEFSMKYGSFDIIAGSRIEDYLITANIQNNKINLLNEYKIFPNFILQYNFNKNLYIKANYSKKINIPNTNFLNPNNVNYQNSNLTYFGNPLLQPTIFDNYEIKISAFDYAYLSYNFSSISNQVASRMEINNNFIQTTNLNINQVKTHNFNFGFPIPYILITKGLKESLNFNFNPDETSFLYFYTGYQLLDFDNLNLNGLWTLSCSSQIVLPYKIKFNTQYTYLSNNADVYYFTNIQPLNHSLDLSISRKFLKDNLSCSIFIDDVFNTNQASYKARGFDLFTNSKFDTRRIGISLNYKFSNNKTVKQEEM